MKDEQTLNFESDRGKGASDAFIGSKSVEY